MEWQMSYNKYFELTPDDIEIIEAALNAKVDRRTRAAILDDGSNRKELLEEANKIRDLLGRLHNQKIWYRPKDGYVGG